MANSPLVSFLIRTYSQVCIEDGRTHWMSGTALVVRVTSAYIHHPIVGAHPLAFPQPYMFLSLSVLVLSGTSNQVVDWLYLKLAPLRGKRVASERLLDVP